MKAWLKYLFSVWMCPKNCDYMICISVTKDTTFFHNRFFSYLNIAVFSLLINGVYWKYVEARSN